MIGCDPVSSLAPASSVSPGLVCNSAEARNPVAVIQVGRCPISKVRVVSQEALL